MIEWIDLNEQMPEPEVFVLTWDGRRVGIDASRRPSSTPPLM